MRLAPVVALLACGGPSFVPVSIRAEDSRWGRLLGEATLKLNPSCASNCELGQAIEDGGCARIENYQCVPGGGVLLLTFDAAPDGGPPYVSRPRNLAVGAEVRFFDIDDAACSKSYMVPHAELSVTLRPAADGGCDFTP